MPYLGNAPAEAYSQISYQDLTGGSGTSFTLDYPAGSAGEIEVFVNNVRQEPTVAYTVSGTSLTMTGSISATDDFYVVFQGKAQQTIGIPEKQTDGTYLFDDSVTIDADGSTVLTVDRATSDGTIIDVQKDGSIVGSIGTDASTGDFYVQSQITNHAGLGFKVNEVLPRRNGYVDGIDNLGSSTYRFSNLYLSGGVYLGGTGSANLLDSYEEGNWTPVYEATSTNPTVSYHNTVGRYRKVGNLVIAWFRISTSTVTSQGSGQLQIAGLPFTATSVSQLFGSTAIGYASAWNGGNAPTSVYNPPSSTLLFVTKRASTDAQDHIDAAVAANDLKTTVGGNDLIGTVIYMTD